MFPERIKELRLKKRYTQKQIADKIGITRPAYTAYESGKRQPDFETLTKLSKIFGVTTDYLLGRSNIPTPDKSIKNNMNDADLDKMLDEAMSFDGKPMNDHDRELIRAYLKGQFANRDK